VTRTEPCRTSSRGAASGDWRSVPHASPADQNHVTGPGASANAITPVRASYAKPVSATTSPQLAIARA
jgi:hypothetical protein